MTKDRLKIDLETGWLEPVTRVVCPHFDERPENSLIDMVVIHGISLPPGRFGTGAVEAFFAGKLDISEDDYYPSIAHLRVSSHLFIKRTGEIVQFVPFVKRAWHAGESSFMGKTRCNDFSIGIELEGTDEVPYEPVQYEQLANLLPVLMQAYSGITLERIVGHSDIAPGRKTDPGPFFEWQKLKGQLA